MTSSCYAITYSNKKTHSEKPTDVTLNFYLNQNILNKYLMQVVNFIKTK